jgi:hypothetical protein
MARPTPALANRNCPLRARPATYPWPSPTTTNRTPANRKNGAVLAADCVAIRRPRRAVRAAAAIQHQKAASTMRGRFDGTGGVADMVGTAYWTIIW